VQSISNAQSEFKMERDIGLVKRIDLLNLAAKTEIFKRMKKLVPEYKSQNSEFEALD
jgi:hypothetical protein